MGGHDELAAHFGWPEPRALPLRSDGLAQAVEVAVMPGTGSIRGDVNAILNRLMGDGVIAGFTTNFDDKATGRVAITVVARPDINPKVTRLAVRTALQQFFSQVRVTVKAG